jgi:hypothetical protein
MMRVQRSCLVTLAHAMAVVLALVAGCGDDDGPVDTTPPTRQEVIDACAGYSEVACQAFGACLGWGEEELADCIADEIASCEPDLEAESCWAAQEAGFLACFDIEDEPCAELCNQNGFCFDFCPYICPPDEEEAAAAAIIRR